MGLDCWFSFQELQTVKGLNQDYKHNLNKKKNLAVPSGREWPDGGCDKLESIDPSPLGLPGVVAMREYDLRVITFPVLQDNPKV